MKKTTPHKHEFIYVLWLFAVTRLLIGVAGYYSVIRLEKFKYYQKLGHWLDPFFQWDSYWYKGIVEKGYFFVSEGSSNVHFFPLFPMMVRALSWLGGGTFVSGFVISNVCLLLALCYFRRLILLDYEKNDIATRSIFYMLIFPTSFWLSIYYPESLFLFLALGAIFHARRREWLIASLYGFFLSLTKTAGFLILVPLVIEYFNIGYKFWKIDFKALRPNIILLGLVPLGTMTYMGYLHLRFGDALAFLHATASWERKFVFFTTTLANASSYSLFERLMYMGAIAVALAAIIYLVVLRVRFSYVIYASCYLFLFVSSNILESVQRYILELFPMYLAMGIAACRSRYVELFLTTFCVMLLTLFVILFTNGYRMY